MGAYAAAKVVAKRASLRDAFLYFCHAKARKSQPEADSSSHGSAPYGRVGYAEPGGLIESGCCIKKLVQNAPRIVRLSIKMLYRSGLILLPA